MHVQFSCLVYVYLYMKSDGSEYSNYWELNNFKSVAEMYRENCVRANPDLFEDMDKIKVNSAVSNHNIEKAHHDSSTFLPKINKNFTDHYTLEQHYKMVKYNHMLLL